MTLDERLASVLPSERQVAFQQLEFYGFIHLTVNTFTDREWGDGTEDPSVFNPTRLDAKQWVSSLKTAGMKGLILTCKHHDGFCLWPSKYTKHTLAASPYKQGKGDIVKEVSDACKMVGLKFGVYLSPWDRNCKVYGQGKAYDDFFVNQLTELLTEYGPVFSVWFDGACGEGPTERNSTTTGSDTMPKYGNYSPRQLFRSADRISDGVAMKQGIPERQNGVLFRSEQETVRLLQKEVSRRMILHSD